MTYGDFRTFTETDPNGHISIVSAREIDVSGLTRNEDAYVYKDYGTDHFKDSFTHYVDAKPITDSGTGGVGVFYELANIIDDDDYITNNAPLIHLWFNPTTTPDYYIQLKTRDGGGTISSDAYKNYTAGQIYYFTIKRSSSQVVVDIYSDSARTNLVDTLTAPMDTTSFRYLYAVNSYNSGNDYAIDYDVYNIDLTPLEAVLSGSISIDSTDSYTNELYIETASYGDEIRIRTIDMT